MGMSTSSCIVPFAAHLDIYFDIAHPYVDLPKVVMDVFGDMERDTSSSLGKGWMMFEEKVHTYKRGKRYCFVDRIINGEMTIYAINESEDASGGGVEPTFFSDTKADLESFMLDFGLNCEIEVDEPIQQTL